MMRVKVVVLDKWDRILGTKNTFVTLADLGSWKVSVTMDLRPSQVAYVGFIDASGNLCYTPSTIASKKYSWWQREPKEPLYVTFHMQPASGEGFRVQRGYKP